MNTTYPGTRETTARLGADQRERWESRQYRPHRPNPTHKGHTHPTLQRPTQMVVDTTVQTSTPNHTGQTPPPTDSAEADQNGCRQFKISKYTQRGVGILRDFYKPPHYTKISSSTTHRGRTYIVSGASIIRIVLSPSSYDYAFDIVISSNVDLN